MKDHFNSLLNFPVILILLVLAYSCQRTGQDQAEEAQSYLKLVRPLMGTDSEFVLSNGNTYPAIAVPWGMNFWTPQTGRMGDGWAYAYDAYRIRGFKQTHQPSPWINDYAAFSLMPLTGNLVFHEDDRASWFSHKAEVVQANYYRVYLADYDVTVEITPTERAAIFRFTFPESRESYILLDAFFKGSKVEINSAENTISGYCRNHAGGVPDNFHNYFVAEFDKSFLVKHTWKNDTLQRDSDRAEGEHVGAVVGFETEKGEQVTVRVASSFISPEQARLNLRRETGNRTFEQVKAESGELWEEELGKIQLTGGTADQQKTFYSCLYRVLLFPRKFYELNQDNEIVHYSPYNGEVLPGYMFTDNGFWDTFRAVFPFFTWMYPELNSQIMQGLVNTYRESGWLPEWASPGHRNSMIGSNSSSIIADSYLKGIRGYDIETLYEALIKNTRGYNREVPAVGRLGADYYNELGYVPYDVGINENAARTLEYAYADFCIAELAKELAKPEEEIRLYEQRGQNFRNVFDPESGLMRGRNEDGTFQSPFNPLKWGDAFTEGNSLHYTWSTFHDFEGLKQMMGGNERFLSSLDMVFQMPPEFDYSYYGIIIHEIREMQIVDMGNYAHGNQPIQHMTYLYNYAGQPWKTQYYVREILDKLYTPHPDGYCGDEDNGQTSAWYVFSALGFYPVCPGTGEYVLGSPLFDQVHITLPNGKSLDILATDNSKDHVYVGGIKFNGNRLTKNYITHEQLLQGGNLVFQMQDSPNKERGTGPSAFPFSCSSERISP